jgi:hypothetical protein
MIIKTIISNISDKLILEGCNRFRH